jgi:hypothetical protein
MAVLSFGNIVFVVLMTALPIRFPATLSKERAERCHQQRAGAQEYRPVGRGKPRDRTLALGSQPDPNLAPVGIATYPFHQTALHQSVGQANGAVMPDQQMLGDFSYGRTKQATMRAGERPDCQQELMLLRLEPLGSGRLFAEMEKAADLKSEIGESSIVRIRQVADRRKGEVMRVEWLDGQR